ncbi:MAG: glycosyltransferase family 4 protein, partial [Candidatus Bathyarchaeia archaeon]
LLISPIAYVLDRIWNFDLVYIRTPILSFGFMLSKKMREKSIVKFPTFFEDELKLKGITAKTVHRIFYLIDRVVLTRCKKVAVGSPLWIPKIEEKRNVHRPPSSYLLLPAGYNPKKMPKINNGRKSGEAESEAKMFRVGFLGSIVKWQGVDVLIKAMRIVQRKEPNTELIIVGDGPLRNAIENLSKTLEVNCTITGNLPHDEALRLLSTFDVMVLPRRRTTTTESTIPIKVIEAWALGIPVIVTKHRVFLDSQIRDYEDVVYCEPEPNSVANAIYLLIANDKLRKKLELNGPQLARRFDYERMAERLLKVFTVE